jgi:hypothetical protein
MIFRFSLGNDRFVNKVVDVIEDDVPLLMGLDLLDEFGIYFDNTIDRVNSSDLWPLPVVRMLGHAYLEWPRHTMLTDIEVRRLHSGFYHPSASVGSVGKLKRYNNLKS